MIEKCTNCGNQYETLPTTIIRGEGNLFGWQGRFCSVRCRKEYQQTHPEQFEIPYWVETVISFEEELKR